MCKRIKQVWFWICDCIKCSTCNFIKSILKAFLQPIWGVCLIAIFFYVLSSSFPIIYKNLTFGANQPPLPTIKCKFNKLEISDFNEAQRLKELKPYSIEIQFEDPPLQEGNIVLFYNNSQLVLAKNENSLIGNNENINYLIIYYKPSPNIKIYGLYQGFPELDKTSNCYFKAFILEQ